MKEINENELKDVTGGSGPAKAVMGDSVDTTCPKGSVLKKGYCIPAEGVGTIPGLSLRLI